MPLANSSLLVTKEDEMTNRKGTSVTRENSIKKIPLIQSKALPARLKRLFRLFISIHPFLAQSLGCPVGHQHQNQADH
ncbi:hypothetical protein D3C73_1421380 [compost metagenome]